MKRRIAIIHFVGQFETVPCLVSTAKMLLDSGFHVALFTVSNNIYPDPSLHQLEVHVLEPPKSSSLSARWTHALVNWLPFLRKTIGKGKFNLIFGVDPRGLLLATATGVSLGIPTAYYSLELLLKNEINRLPPRILKTIEVYCSQRAKFSVIQDEMRANILSRENKIRRQEIVLLPNSYLGPAIVERTNYLHQKLGIPQGKKIILHIGSIEEFSSSIPLAQAAHTWENNWVLVFHTRRSFQNNAYEIKFLQLIDNCHVYLSDKPVSHEMLKDVVASADVGIALYNAKPSGKNVYCMGLSSGKLALYLKQGLPVIVSDLPLINTMVQQYGCGVCVRSCEEIGPCLINIWKHYKRYRTGAIRCFEETWRFEHRFPALLDKLKADADKGPKSRG